MVKKEKDLISSVQNETLKTKELSEKLFVIKSEHESSILKLKKEHEAEL